MTHVWRNAGEPARRADTPGATRRRPAGLAALAPLVGNRAMRRLARAPAHPLEKQIDAMRGLAKQGMLEMGRDSARARLTEPGGDRQVLLAAERIGDALMAGGRFKSGERLILSEAQHDAILDRQMALGRVAQRGVRTGLEYAEKDAKTPEAQLQVRLVREDIKVVQDQFRTQVRENAFSLLDQSRDRILEMLKSYGLRTAHASDLVRKVLRDDDDIDDAVDEWLEYAHKGRRAEYEAPEAAAARGGLTQQIDRLRKLQSAVVDLQSEYVRQFDQSPLSEAERRGWDRLRHKAERTGIPTVADIGDDAKALERRINEARRKLSAAWIAAERSHPVLAAHRGRESAHLEWVDLGGYEGDPLVPIDDDEAKRRVRIMFASRRLGKATSSATHERAAVRQAVRKLANIERARWAIQQHKLSPLTLVPVVRFTEKQLFIAPRSAWAAAVNAVVEPETGFLEEGFEFVKSLFDFALLVLSAVPNPMAPAAVLYDVGRNLYVAVDEYVKQGLAESYSNTDLDAARSLSDKVPSLTGFAMALVGAGLSLAMLKSTFEAAAAARRGLLAGEEGALARLDEIGQTYGMPKLGEEVAQAEGVEARITKVTQEPVGAGGGGLPQRTQPALQDPELAGLGRPRSRARPYRRKPPRGSEPTGPKGGGRPKKRAETPKPPEPERAPEAPKTPEPEPIPEPAPHPTTTEPAPSPASKVRQRIRSISSLPMGERRAALDAVLEDPNGLSELANHIHGIGQQSGATVELCLAEGANGEVFYVAGLNSSARWSEAQIAELRAWGFAGPNARTARSAIAPTRLRAMGARMPHAEENIVMHLRAIGAKPRRWSNAVVGAGRRHSDVCRVCRRLIKDVGGQIEPLDLPHR